MISIYSGETLEKIGAVLDYTSFVKRSRFYDVGDFELHIPKNSPNQKYLKPLNIIHHKGFYGIILTVNKSDDVTVTGYDLKGLCTFRMVIPPFVYKEVPTVTDGYDRISGKGEAVMRHYITTQLLECEDEKRKIPIELEADGGRGKDMVWQSKFESLDAVMKSVGEFCELGYEIVLGDKKFLYRTLQGSDRTVTQKERPYVLFGEDTGGFLSPSYTVDYKAAANVCYMAGNGEEEQQKVFKIYEDKENEPFGIFRAETYGEQASDDINDVYDMGNSVIKEQKFKENIEGEAQNTSGYKSEWFLGDYVTLAVDVYGERLFLDKQITEVEEVYERSNIRVIPTFGEKKNISIRKLLRRI